MAATLFRMARLVFYEQGAPGAFVGYGIFLQSVQAVR